MSRKFVYICSNPKCNKSLLLGSVDKSFTCTKCGEGLMVECPHCTMPFVERGQTFCLNCGKRIKELPPSDSQ